MPNKGQQIHKWIAKKHLQLFFQNKLVLPSIQQRQQRLKRCLKKNHDGGGLQKETKELQLTHQQKQFNFSEQEIGTLNQFDFINGQKKHISWQVKEWINIIRTMIIQGQKKLNENDLSKLQQSLHKWCSYLEQIPPTITDHFVTPITQSSERIYENHEEIDRLTQKYESKLKQQKYFFQNQLKKLSKNCNNRCNQII